jgi:ParB-like chromosome segregation protein Spo0J
MEEFIEICLITVNKQPVGDDHVEDFIELLEAGKVIPPIVLRASGDAYILVDGRHRLLAHKRLGRTHIKARITL